ncbi:RsfA family transcriptional regulator [Aquibacillus albus]|uniref:Prespore-specific regulator n=1 Tax=Aquibacillus albus TaxID=1168171 RepID=A0ABS2MUH7_9BACI|nr:RsfA family transcriptional regulator [Aquibacillus albus]MBM7569559.1 prespore-specific regulator [Aquibacillus albus]
MVKVRQDAWSHEDDLLLAETVLRHIREGSTQLNAFEEVGDKLNRTSAACGFRWNAEVRQRYEQAVAIAKRQRKEKKRAQAREQKALQQPQTTTTSSAKYYEENSEVNMLKENAVTENSSQMNHSDNNATTRNQALNLDTVIDYLYSLKKEYHESSQSKFSLEQMTLDNEKLREENESLLKKNTQLQEQLKTIQEDYQVLINIMDRARKMVVFDEDENMSTPAFRMEKNGNLEQVAR